MPRSAGRQSERIRQKNRPLVFLFVAITVLAFTEENFSNHLADAKPHMQDIQKIDFTNCSAKADGFEEREIAFSYLSRFESGTKGEIGPFSSNEKGIWADDTAEYERQKRLYERLVDDGICVKIDISNTEYTLEGNDRTLLRVWATITLTQNGELTRFDRVISFHFDKTDESPVIYCIENEGDSEDEEDRPANKSQALN